MIKISPGLGSVNTLYFLATDCNIIKTPPVLGSAFLMCNSLQTSLTHQKIYAAHQLAGKLMPTELRYFLTSLPQLEPLGTSSLPSWLTAISINLIIKDN